MEREPYTGSDFTAYDICSQEIAASEYCPFRLRFYSSE